MHDKPRHEYYAFAHQAIPDIFFNDPKLFFDTLIEHGPIFPRYIWKQLEKLAQPEYESRSKEILVDFSNIGNISVALITLPPPNHPTEVFFIALLHYPKTSSQNNLYRLLTLEYGVNLDGEAYAVFSEWENKDMHRNLGVVPTPTKESFLHKIEDVFSISK